MEALRPCDVEINNGRLCEQSSIVVAHSQTGDSVQEAAVASIGPPEFTVNDSSGSRAEPKAPPATAWLGE